MYQVIRHGTHDHLAVFGLLLCRCAHGGMEGGQVIKLISHRSRQTPFNEITASLTQKRQLQSIPLFVLDCWGKKHERRNPQTAGEGLDLFFPSCLIGDPIISEHQIYMPFEVNFFLDTLERHTRLLSYISVATQGIYKADFFGCLSIQTCQQPCRHQHFFFSPTRQIPTT